MLPINFSDLFRCHVNLALGANKSKYEKIIVNYKLILFDCFLWIHVFLRICFRKHVVVNKDKTAVLRSSIVKNDQKKLMF